MAKKELERRAYSFDIKAEESERGNIITGRPIVYNSRTNIGLFDEIIESGALNQADLTDVRFLVNHDVSKIPLARSRRNNGNSTMQLTVDERGMGITVQLDTENNAEARSLYSAVQRGDITGMSFLFGIPKGGDEWEGLDTEHPTRHILAIKRVLEVSAVTFPAYEATSIQARGLSSALDSAKESLDSVKAELRKVELQKQKIRIMSEV
jgi:HK97 family phage prohead protease